MPSRPREFHPEPLTDSGREPLDSSGSCHRVETAVSRQDRRFLPFPVALPILSSVTHPLRSTGITLPHRYYGVVRPWLAHPYCRPHGFPACAFSVTIAHQVLKFHTKARMRFTLPIHRTPHGQQVGIHHALSRDKETPPVLMSFEGISMRLQQFACARLSHPYMTRSSHTF